MKAFRNTDFNKITLTFPNGNSISTIWGAYSYSENKTLGFLYNRNFLNSANCEVMILNAPEKLVKKIHKKFNGDGSIIAYLDITDWLSILNMLAKGG